MSRPFQHESSRDCCSYLTCILTSFLDPDNADNYNAEQTRFDKNIARPDPTTNPATFSTRTARFPAQVSPQPETNGPFSQTNTLAESVAHLRAISSDLLIRLQVTSLGTILICLCLLVWLWPLAWLLRYSFDLLACTVLSRQSLLSLPVWCSASALANEYAVVKDQICLYPGLGSLCLRDKQQKANNDGFGPAVAVLEAQTRLGRLAANSYVFCHWAENHDITGMLNTTLTMQRVTVHLKGSGDMAWLKDFEETREELVMHFKILDKTAQALTSRLWLALQHTFNQTKDAALSIHDREAVFADQSASARWRQTGQVAGHRAGVVADYLTVVQAMHDKTSEALEEGDFCLREGDVGLKYIASANEVWSGGSQLRQKAMSVLHAEINLRKWTIFKFLLSAATFKSHQDDAHFAHGEAIAILSQEKPWIPEFEARFRHIAGEVHALCAEVGNLEARFQREPMPMNRYNASWHLPHLSAAITDMDMVLEAIATAD